MGNLLLVGLIDATGDLEESVRALAQVMGVTGTIVPASCEGVVLVATTEEGDRGVRPRWRGPPRFVASASSRRDPAAPIAAVEAIERADVVVIGPGSLFTSVIAACVVPGITQALAGTAAKKIYVANLHAEIPETEGFTLQDHVDALARHGVDVDRGAGRRALARSRTIPATVADARGGPRGRKWSRARCAKIGGGRPRGSAKTEDRQRRRRQWQHGSRLMDLDVSGGVSCAPRSTNPDVEIVAINDLVPDGDQRPPA